MSDDTLVVFHSPQTRSSGTVVLLEELGCPYELHLVNMKAGDQRKPEYLAVNPMGKVPAIRHRGELVTEQVAIYLYLADEFAQAGLAPVIGDPLRGPYLRWFAFYAACLEPAMVDRAMKREPGMPAMSPYGDFDTMFAALRGQLAAGPYWLGERFTALDVLWGGALNWMTRFGLVPATPEVAAYVERITTRPAFRRVEERDAELAARHETEAKTQAA